ncbi:MAG: CaiB/BaiF CoA transferase family protein [Actinomycetes bacterium]
MAGPLEGVKVVELAGLGPAPFAAMVLADLGADVLRVERAGGRGLDLTGGVAVPLDRGRRRVAVDLKHPDGAEAVLTIVESADVLLEGFRPGVLERLGLGPEVLLARNPGLVVGRMTGWGQDGPLADRAGHDIDYIAVAGALAHCARHAEAPVPPMNLVGDFGGGGMLLVSGVLAALVARGRTGQGQVVDAAMVDGTALLMAMQHGFLAAGVWDPTPGVNLLDTGAPFYDVYGTRDGGHVAVGALEPQFFAELVATLGLGEDVDVARQYDRSTWVEMRSRFSATFAERTRDEWAEVFAGTDACVAPVLRMDEAPTHPHLVARGTFVEVDGVVQPAPAPRFSGTPTTVPSPPTSAGAEAELAGFGLDADTVAELVAGGALG